MPVENPVLIFVPIRHLPDPAPPPSQVAVRLPLPAPALPPPRPPIPAGPALSFPAPTCSVPPPGQPAFSRLFVQRGWQDAVPRSQPPPAQRPLSDEQRGLRA
ncbi:hypothetical protein PICMEDRAFT_80122 [Pichia membranifaciens NRRL Y-2026]|uniref:Uncharacterized protein n=1 Tax=Pichia membranifaciens NRRL Y-2026 TaxID=763406 RepID=A0A1E3NRM4_9ASCO|nr:hypothetical protein PICMEDRAFT_80122 [Pichia membranifaciens NRRL Y-2026]ODQ48338.1 hypothetical protein PICMEDRAFT_80122 [Pichia membranifaciens NRRL Y-2026]